MHAGRKRAGQWAGLAIGVTAWGGSGPDNSNCTGAVARNMHFENYRRLQGFSLHARLSRQAGPCFPRRLVLPCRARVVWRKGVPALGDAPMLLAGFLSGALDGSWLLAGRAADPVCVGSKVTAHYISAVGRQQCVTV